jgi:hypothetical protein
MVNFFPLSAVVGNVTTVAMPVTNTISSLVVRVLLLLTVLKVLPAAAGVCQVAAPLPSVVSTCPLVPPLPEGLILTVPFDTDSPLLADSEVNAPDEAVVDPIVPGAAQLIRALSKVPDVIFDVGRTST